MRFLVHIPNGKQGISAQEAMESVGLGELAHGVDVLPSDGPDGGGVMIGWLDSTNADARYLPDEQTWVPASTQWGGELGRYWVGLWNDSPPTENELRRPDHRRGAQIKLGNGEHWSVATPNTIQHFPHFDAEGKLAQVPDAQFNWLTTDLDKFKASRITQNEDDPTSVFVSFDFEEDFDFICRLLQVNYRVTPEVIAQMKLLDVDAIREMIAALMDHPLKA